jgi:diguanylate cyclase (GGDEF)-like protein
MSENASQHEWIDKGGQPDNPEIEKLKKRNEELIKNVASGIISVDQAIQESDHIFTTAIGLDPLFPDVVTKLGFARHIHDHVKFAKRYGTSLVLCVVDGDSFKEVNNYGRPVGDRAIYTMADSFQSHLRRSGDIIGHLGGDDWLVLMEGNTYEGNQSAIHRMRLIQNTLAELSPRNVPELPHPLTISSGMAMYHPGVDRYPSMLYKRADDALQRVKQIPGKNRIGISKITKRSGNVQIQIAA